jgi:hypothetical protein
LKSASAFRNWRRRDPEIDDQVRSLPRRLLVEHLADVYAAHVAVATLPDPKATAERRLFFGVLREPQSVRLRLRWPMEAR